MRSKDKSKPNIIIIFADDLGYGDLACYGSSVNRTPRLDRMAQEGVLFTDFYVAQPVCSPSRAAIMTGCYPKRIGLEKGEDFLVLLPGDAIGLSPEEITIPDALKTQGYTTRIIGKWHIGDQEPFMPLNHGFDSYFGLPYSNDMKPPTEEELQRLRPDQLERRSKCPPLPLIKEREIIETNPDQAALTDRYTKDAVSFIRENRDEPFFLYFAHMYVHLPIHVPERFLQKAQNGPYGAAVEHTDHCTGVILDTLAELGIDDNTLVIFTSDNGSNGRNGGSNAPLRGAKGSTWEGGMREPCIMRWPGKIPAGTTCREVCTTMDFLPTLAHLTGASAPTDRVIDGRDIRPLIFGEQAAKSPYEAFFYYAAGRLEAVRSGRWKLSARDNALYDLEADIGETTNVMNEHPDIVKKLEGYLQGCREELGDDATGVVGKGCRPCGKVDHPVTIRKADGNDPLVKAEYD